MWKLSLKAVLVAAGLTLSACVPVEGQYPGRPPGSPLPGPGVSAELVRQTCRAEAVRVGWEVRDFQNVRQIPVGAEVDMRVRQAGTTFTVLCRYYTVSRTAQLLGGPGGGIPPWGGPPWGGPGTPPVTQETVRQACRVEASRLGYDVAGYSNDRLTPSGGEVTLQIRVPGPNFNVLCRYTAATRTAQIAGGPGGTPGTPPWGGPPWGGPPWGGPGAPPVTQEVVRQACRFEANRLGYDVVSYSNDRLTSTGGEVTLQIRRPGPNFNVLCRYTSATRTAQIVGGPGGTPGTPPWGGPPWGGPGTPPVTQETVRQACRQEAVRLGHQIAAFSGDRLTPTGGEVVMRVRVPGRPDFNVLCTYDARSASVQIQLIG